MEVQFRTDLKEDEEKSSYARVKLCVGSCGCSAGAIRNLTPGDEREGDGNLIASRCDSVRMAEMQWAITSLTAMQNQFQTSWSSQQADLQRTMLEEI
ncbi:hypothetical protein ACFX2I_031617 [Malus domestica]